MCVVLLGLIIQWALHPVLYMSAQCTACDFVPCLRPGDACHNIGKEAMRHFWDNFTQIGCYENVSPLVATLISQGSWNTHKSDTVAHLCLNVPLAGAMTEATKL